MSSHANKDLILCWWCHVKLQFRHLCLTKAIKVFKTGFLSILGHIIVVNTRKCHCFGHPESPDKICFSLNLVLHVGTWRCRQVQVSTSPVCHQSARLQPVSWNIQQCFSGLGLNLCGIRQTFWLLPAFRYFSTTHKGASVRSYSRSESHVETSRSKCQVTSGLFGKLIPQGWVQTWYMILPDGLDATLSHHHRWRHEIR